MEEYSCIVCHVLFDYNSNWHQGEFCYWNHRVIPLYQACDITLSSLLWPWQLLTSYLLSYLSDWTRWQIYTRPHAQMLRSVKWDRFWPLIGWGLCFLWGLRICYLYCLVVDRNSVKYCSSICSQNRKNLNGVGISYSTRQSFLYKKDCLDFIV